MLAYVLVLALQHPEPPAQYCRDDAGPPWPDDFEHYPTSASGPGAVVLDVER